MKKFKSFTLLMMTMFLFGCLNDNDNLTDKHTNDVNVMLPDQRVKLPDQYYDEGGYEVLTIDSCEYIYAWFGSGNGGGSLTHKGNCKFCSIRANKSSNK